MPVKPTTTTTKPVSGPPHADNVLNTLQLLPLRGGLKKKFNGGSILTIN